MTIILCAYAYTGDVPKFLGTWTVQDNGEDARLESLDGAGLPVSVVGFRLVEDSVKEMSEIEYEAKQAKIIEKAEKKEAKENEKFENQIKKVEYQRKIKQMDVDTIFKLQQRQEELKRVQKENKKNNKKESSTELL